MIIATSEFLSRAANVPPPKLKTARERLKGLVKERRVAVKRNIPASGISGENGEMEQILNSTFEVVDDKAPPLRNTNLGVGTLSVPF